MLNKKKSKKDNELMLTQLNKLTEEIESYFLYSTSLKNKKNHRVILLGNNSSYCDYQDIDITSITQKENDTLQITYKLYELHATNIYLKEIIFKINISLDKVSLIFIRENIDKPSPLSKWPFYFKRKLHCEINLLPIDHILSEILENDINLVKILLNILINDLKSSNGTIFNTQSVLKTSTIRRVLYHSLEEIDRPLKHEQHISEPLIKNKTKSPASKNNSIEDKQYTDNKLIELKCPRDLDMLYFEKIVESNAFDIIWYEKKYRSNLKPIDYENLLNHYIKIGYKESFNPSELFDTEFYLKENTDVASSGVHPFLHYVTNGINEERKIKPFDDVVSDPTSEIKYGWENYHEIKNIISKYNTLGIRDDSISYQLNELEEYNYLNSIYFKKYESSQKIKLSIIILCWNELNHTISCLIALSNALTYSIRISYEIILYDNGSTDNTQKYIKKINNITFIHNDNNIGFGSANNKAALLARGKYIFFLNNDAQVNKDTIINLISTIESDNSIGAVGPKIISTDGRLQEAGAYIDIKGNSKQVGYTKSPNEKRFNYRREVYYISGAALCVKRSIFLAVGGFDPIYTPAYCEDSDLCYKLRNKGLRIIYEPKASIIHYLSATSNNIAPLWKNKLIISNQQKFMEKWKNDLSKENSDIRLIAFYLPQYHPIPENDLWWGKGFTEWRSLSKAKPNYEGHRQPRYPADLGYYDLRLEKIMEEQANLAKRYGLYGFCYYYYWFDGKRLLEQPLENMLNSGKPNLPFCLCWANESWTRSWDGDENVKKNDLLIAQDYKSTNDIAVIADIIRYMRSPNYIKINNKPILLIYRVKDFPNFKETSRKWRDFCRERKIGEICLVMVESFELSPQPEDPHNYGCDISVEFPPHGMVGNEEVDVEVTNPDYSGVVRNYRDLIIEYVKREEPGFTRLRSILVGWDNTPRRQHDSLVLEDATPGAFQAWLEWVLQRTKEQNYGDERIVFINAWNEWCEGSYLEPDTEYGHAYLQAIRNALDVTLDT